MPELPEVETIRRGLQEYLVGHTIVDVEVKSRKIFSGEAASVRGAKVTGVRRFAKVLSIDLSNGISLVIHIKLTGQLIYRGPNLKSPPKLSGKVLGLPGKHTHAIFHLNRGGRLYYNDVRKFGWIKIIQNSKLKIQNEFVAKLGPEPFAGLTKEKFVEIVSKYKTPIKPFLMDQENIGGMGNIYANDALWLSKIHPKRPANSLSSREKNDLYEAVLTVLKKGLKYHGASELSFVKPDGSEGSYQEHFLVYAQRGKLCQRCKKAKIIKTRLAGRGTYYCPTCQSTVPF